MEYANGFESLILFKLHKIVLSYAPAIQNNMYHKIYKHLFLFLLSYPHMGGITYRF